MNPFSWLTQVIQSAIVHLTNIFSGASFLNALGAYGLAVIVVTLGIRLLLWPLFRWQYQTQLNMAADNQIVQPRLAELRKKYKGQQLNTEMQKMYQELGMNPLSSLSGCIPLVIQLLLLFPVYNAIKASAHSLKGHVSFLWIPNLTKSVFQICCQAPKGQASPGAIGIVTHLDLVLLPVVVALITFAQVKMMATPGMTPAADAKGKPQKPSQQEELTQSMSKTMPVVSAVMFFVMGIEFAQGLVLYWTVTTLFGVIQQYFVMGWGNLRVPPYFPGVGRTAMLRERREIRIKERISSRKKSNSIRATP